jgi:hypothetical protein
MLTAKKKTLPAGQRIRTLPNNHRSTEEQSLELLALPISRSDYSVDSGVNLRVTPNVAYLLRQ